MFDEGTKDVAGKNSAFRMNVRKGTRRARKDHRLPGVTVHKVGVKRDELRWGQSCLVGTEFKKSHSNPLSSLTPPMDLRHMTSNTGLGRPAKHIRTADHRLDSRSPDSIPSSPTSVHSSSSAIFERDIEPISIPSPSHHPRNPHRVPRAKGTEALEQSVPSVLDSAAAILGNLQDVDVGEQVAVVSPSSAIGRVSNSGFASPIGSYRSRSPSPLGSRVTSRAADLLFSIPTSPTSVLGLQNLNIPSPSPPRVVPGDYASSVVTSVDAEEPPTTTQEHPPPKPISPSYPPISLATSPIASPSSLQSHPPSPIHVAKKRLSFMSYSDLLSSTPQSTQTLSSLTTCASSTEPPPHIPSISGLNIASAMQAQQFPGSKAPSLHRFALGPTGGLTHPGKRDSIAMLDNVGGEWEKEGLGRGLEERLDALVIPPAVDSPVVGVAPVAGRVQGKAVA
ncbi:hypothetical protein M413DRAFT_421635 [Hebeloma cylindrosporum]|uniref:Uncharacterized protein n=1 Tax=Hebeloma cylindrosporum TaxID=76867 RepID=A0A0C3BLI7_HEBCY|nr:hypothetical protein M413DRAFT_421635 [Hebeloma cylindrosporum h7]